MVANIYTHQLLQQKEWQTGSTGGAVKAAAAAAWPTTAIVTKSKTMMKKKAKAKWKSTRHKVVTGL